MVRQHRFVKVPPALIVVAFSLSVAVSLYAQVTGATLSGAITDPSGSAIAGAQVSIRNTATDISKDIQADSTGFYTVPDLAPGPYEIRVTAPGFSATVSVFTLAVGAQQTLNLQLKIGESSQTVEVTDVAPQIELTSSTLTGVVESKTVLDLPLNGRDWTTLAALQPGVNLIENQIAYSDSGRGNRGFGSQLTISGQRTISNNYRLDGISINDYANSGPGNVIGAALGVDAIQEFSVLTGGFSAEYGKASGGVVNAITKSGTNTFHGDAYEFIRNSALDSRDYFSRSANTPLAEFRRNQFGIAAGGPIIKDRTFIFGDYEGFRQIKGVTTSVTVPSDNARQGILANGTIIPVDPAAAAGLQMFPHATPGTTSGDKGSFIFSGLQIVPENFYTVHVDHKLSSKDALFGTYLFDDTDFTQPNSDNDTLNDSHTTRSTVVLEWSHTFAANLVNAARVGYSRTHALNGKAVGAINPAASDPSLASVPGQDAPAITIGGYTIEPGGVGALSFYDHNYNSDQFDDDAFWTSGAHTLKFGANIERIQYNFLNTLSPAGRWIFSNITDYLTNNARHFDVSLTSTIAPRELRQSIFAGYAQDDWRARSNLMVNLGLRYEMATVINDAQGKISNLVNFSDSQPQCGVLYVAAFAPQGMHIPGTACGSVGPYYHNPTYLNFEPRVGFAWDPFKSGKTSVRGGFGVYDILPDPGMMSIAIQNKSGPFLIDSSLNKPGAGPNPLAGQFAAGGYNLATNPPVGLSPGLLTVAHVEQNPSRNYVLEWNFNVQRQITPDLSVTLGYVGSHGVHMLTRGDDGNTTLPTLTSAGYLFPCGPTSTTPNTCTPGLNAAGESAKVNTVVGAIPYIYWDADSAYNAMNINVDKRLSHGLQFGVSYTWGKSLDDSSATIAGDTFTNSLNSLYWFAPKSLRGRSDFDVAHSASINVLWALPSVKSNRILETVAGDWQVGGILTLNSGLPTTVIVNGDPAGLGNGGADQFGIPDLIPGCDPVNHHFVGGPAPSYINVNCYRFPTVSASSPLANQCGTFSDGSVNQNAGNPPSGQVWCPNLLGNAGRNTLIGPKLVNLDFSATKNFPIRRVSEAFNVQFRAEIFNILNHSNFLPPEPLNGGGIFDDTGATIANGYIDTLATQPRDVQFALKVIW